MIKKRKSEARVQNRQAGDDLYLLVVLEEGTKNFEETL
jgi:hypothetical protein